MKLGVKLWRMSRERYDRIIAKGLFDSDDRLELLDGLLVERARQTPLHASAGLAAREVLEKAFDRRYHARSHHPVALDDMSEPEPDIAIVSGGPRDYMDAHPSKPALIVEVADESLAKDRFLKGGLYARAGIADYWIVNLVDEVLEVYREPVRAPSRRYGWKYGRVKLLRRGAKIGPLAAPRARIRVADLLP